MDKIILIIVLAVLCIVLFAALKKKNIIDVLRSGPKKIPKITFDINKKPENNGSTIIIPNLYLYQLNENGTYSAEFGLYRSLMKDETGEMVGIPISHPGANCKGITLRGKTTAKGQFDEKDPATYQALTVPTRAVVVGYDDDGFYGEVTSDKTRVYTAYQEGGKTYTEYVPYGKTFDINDGTYLLIGYQWLYFKLPEPLPIPGAPDTAGSGFSNAPVPPKVEPAQHVGMNRRKPNTGKRTTTWHTPESGKTPPTDDIHRGWATPTAGNGSPAGDTARTRR